ncbi:RNA polymerase sigma factor [Streptomyces sp. 8N114]|uniref:RNA polymerase sigma factor n=1 Tax=Streptomyces sp. 8N114 TaxID=3457419 RepID=UPI003FD50FC3
MAESGAGVGLTLDEVYALRYGELVGYTRRMLREAEVAESFIGAEDVVQNAFTKAYRDPARIEQPRAYLYRVIKNEVQECSRRARQATAQTQREARVSSADVGDAVAERCDVHRALRALPEQQRTAVYAAKALDYTQAEVAVVMGKKPGTIATHVARATAVLRTALTVASVLAAVLLCAAGMRAVRRYNAAKQPGSQLPDPLQDLPQPLAFLLWGAAVLVGCAALGLATLRIRRMMQERRRWRKPENGSPDYGYYRRNKVPDYLKLDGPGECPACKTTTVFVRATEAEERRTQPDRPIPSPVYKCQNDCGFALYDLNGMGGTANLRVSERSLFLPDGSLRE